MVEGIYHITCDRPGCNRLIGVQLFSGGKVVEEEWEEGVEITEEGNTYCNECRGRENEFITLEELAEEIR